MAARDEPFPGSSAVTYHAYCVARTTVKGSGGGRPAPATVRAGSVMILPGTRLLLVVFGGLTFLAFLALFVMAGHTDRYFAWPIVPPVTAAFFGAAYAAGRAGGFLGLRAGRRGGGRPCVPRPPVGSVARYPGAVRRHPRLPPGRARGDPAAPRPLPLQGGRHRRTVRRLALAGGLRADPRRDAHHAAGSGAACGGC